MSSNWHWDEKNYGKWSQEYLSNAIKGVNFSVHSTPISIDGINFTGHTTVSMRKGAQIVTYEYEIKVNWSVKLNKPAESNCDHIKGLFDIKEFDTENLEDESYIMSVKINCHDTHNSVLKDFKNNYFKLVKKALSNFTKDLKEHDAKKATVEKEVIVKITEREKPAILNPSPPPSGNTVSAWNHNGYHWEEKPMTKWSQSEIKNLLESRPIVLDNLSINLKDTTATGEASVTIRRGNKVIYYDFVIKAKWEEENCSGNLEINNFNSAENADQEIDASGEFEIKYVVEKGSLDKKKVTAAIISRLNEFINLLKMK